MQYLQTAPELVLTTQKKAAWMNLLDVLSDLVDDYSINPAGGFGANNWMGYDVIRNGAPPNVAFKVYYDLRGTNHGAAAGVNAIVFDWDRGELTVPKIEYDYSAYANYVRVGGEGEGAAQTIAALQANIEELRRGGPFGRREIYVTGEGTNTSFLVTEGYRALVNNRPFTRVSARLASIPDKRYGLHWNHGDIVRIRMFGYEADCRVTQVHVTVSETGEDVEATVTSTRPWYE
jgi:hypothetical protein